MELCIKFKGVNRGLHLGNDFVIAMLSYIHPVLEYGGIIWDNCTNQNKKELKNVQLAACRVITGAKRGISHQLLYIETGLEPLAQIRQQQKHTIL